MASPTVAPLNPASWILAPAALAAVASLVLAVPVAVFGLRAPEPVFALVLAFAWPVIRPSVMAPLTLLVLGIFLDGLWGGPFGFWPLCLLAAHGFAYSARPILIAEDFWALWAWYAAACGVALGAGVMLTMLAAGQVPTLVGLALQFAVTVALFPASWLLIDRYEDADVRFR